MCDQQRLRSACAYAQSDQSLRSSLEYSMTVMLLIEDNLESLSLKGGCTGSPESTMSKYHIGGNHMPRVKFIITLRLNIIGLFGCCKVGT